MENLRQFVSAILAGGMIAMGGVIYLSVENPVIGSCLFAVGLFTVVVFSLHLFTGKVGYLPLRNPRYLVELAITWAGNFVGTFLVAKAIQQTRVLAKLNRVDAIVTAKLEDTPLSIFILAIFCGMLMFIAVDTYKNAAGSTIRTVAVFVCVMVFILAGFEHVIANMFYFSLANAWTGLTWKMIFFMTLGNSVGGMLIPLYQRIFQIKA